MGKKCLIVYASRTGNTEKVALRIKSTFEKRGWSCDSFKITRKMDLSHLPFKYSDYDFVCIGSGIELHEPYPEIIYAVRGRPGVRYISSAASEQPVLNSTAMPGEIPEGRPEGGKPPQHHRIVFGPGSKKAIVFVTYSGYDLGPREADPALAWIALEVEHLEFECIGQFKCLGRFLNAPTPETFWGDIRDRPNERDLKKAETFIEEKLEELRI